MASDKRISTLISQPQLSTHLLHVVRLDVLLVVHGGLLLHVVGDDDLVGLRGGALDGGAQALRLGAVTARLLPVEWVRLPHSASLHRPLEYPGDHGVVRLVRVLQHLDRDRELQAVLQGDCYLQMLHELLEVRGEMFQQQPAGDVFTGCLLAI